MYASNRIHPTLALAIATLLLLGLDACGNNNAPTGKVATSKPAVAASAAMKTAPAPAGSSAQAQARIESMSVQDLLAAGNTAINQQKLVAPKGDNAFEYYEKALQKDPRNQAAQDALREQFPFGVNVVEQAISQNNFDEAQREIGLLATADSGNYTLKILDSKLSAAKAQQQRLADQKAKQAADLAARQAEAKAAAIKAASAPPPLPPPPVVQKPVVQQAQPAPTVAQQPPKAATPPAPEPEPSGETRAAQAISPAAPEYPLQAARNNQSGNVTVQFTVGPDGSVSNVHVISSTAHIFESPAVEAVSRSKFKPALKDGQPVSSVMQRRIAFNMGG